MVGKVFFLFFIFLLSLTVFGNAQTEFKEGKINSSEEAEREFKILLDAQIKLFQHKNFDEGMKILTPLLAVNHPDALYYKGIAIHDGIGTDANEKEGLEYIVHAANLGSGYGRHFLGRAELNIFSKTQQKKNLENALEWFKLAAKSGHLFSYRMLWFLYGNESKIKNDKLAKNYFQKALELGEPDTLRLYATCLFDGTCLSLNIEKDENLGEQYMKLSAGNNSASKLYLARYFAESGKKSNLETALAFLWVKHTIGYELEEPLISDLKRDFDNFKITLSQEELFAVNKLELISPFRQTIGIYPTKEFEKNAHKISNSGFEIGTVTKGSIAERVGLRAGDLVVESNGEPIHSILQLAYNVQLNLPGNEIDIVILRNGKKLKFKFIPEIVYKNDKYRLPTSKYEMIVSAIRAADNSDFVLKDAGSEKANNIDTQIPLITASSRRDSETNARIFGKVTDNVEVAEVTVNGESVRLGSDGAFETSFYVPRGGKVIEIIAFDKKGNKATKTIGLERGAIQQAAGPIFASLNPSGRRVANNKDALALIIGVSDYKRTSAKAAYADKDAQMFYDYAMLKLGIPASNIKELVNTNASEIDVRLAIKDWLARTTKQGRSDVYVFFAGHGLADQTGEEMYLLPHDGEPRLLEDTAISRERLFSDIASANPRSVTVFLDTCYSGTTRGTDMLIAARPIAIRAKQQNIPDGFTVFTAAGGDQTAKPLEEAKHGMFSYFLMKGMEGDADSNNDNQITAAELHQYVEENVVQQSGGSQVPELQGDANRVLVRFQ